MFCLGKAVFKATAIIILTGLPFSVASAKMAAMRNLAVTSLAADAGLVHKTGMRPIAGAYRSTRPAGSGAISGKPGYRRHHGSHPHRGSGWFAGRSWFGHHSWFNRRPHRQPARPLGPTASQTASPVANALPAARPHAGSQAGEISASPRAGITLQDKAYRALIRATYPVALHRKPRIRHVNRQSRRVHKIARRPVARSYVRWSSKAGRRNASMAPFIRRY